MAETFMRIVEASCIAGAAAMMNASLAVRATVGAVTLASLVFDVITAEKSTFPFRPNFSRGITVSLSIMPLVFASQIALKPGISNGHTSFLFRLAVVSAVLFIVLLKKSPGAPNIFDRITFAAVVAVIFCIFSYVDWLRALWLILAHFFFIQVLIIQLPNTFTIGEAYLIAFFLALIIYNGIASMLISVLAFLPSFCIPFPVVSVEDPFVVLAQYALLALAGVVMATSILIPDLERSPEKDKISSEFWARFIVIGLVFDIGLLFKLDNEPVVFILKSIAHHQKRLSLVTWWFSILSLSLISFKKIESYFGCRVILSRKLYHFLITLIVVPGIYLDLGFLAFSLVVALSIFIICELIRVAQISKLSLVLQQYMYSYVNSNLEPALAGRDCGPVILAHIYLLVGCALPIWLHLPFTDSKIHISLLPAFAGVLALGVCDSAAAYVGIRWGTVQWPGSKRTIQGSIAAFLSAVVSLLFLKIWLGDSHTSIAALALSALGLSMMEAFLDQVDNLFLPLFFYSTLCMIV